MLTIILQINGREIGCFRVHNTQNTDTAGFTEYNIYDDGGESVGSVWHAREHGTTKLTQKVMEVVDEDLLEQ